MGIMNWLGIGDEIAKPIDAVGKLYTTDKDRIEVQAKYSEVVQRPQLAQLENNKLLILTGNLFNGGWMPLLGWTCGFLILIYYAPQILIITYVWGKDCVQKGVASSFPMKSEEILNLVYLLFGMGGLNVVKKKISED